MSGERGGASRRRQRAVRHRARVARGRRTAPGRGASAAARRPSRGVQAAATKLGVSRAKLVADREYFVAEGRDEALDVAAEGTARRRTGGGGASWRAGDALGAEVRPQPVADPAPAPTSRNEGVGAADAARSRAAATRRGRRRRAPEAAADAATSPLTLSWIAAAVWSTRRHWRSIASSAAAAPASSSASSREASSSAAAGFVVPVDQRMQVVALAREIGERRLEGTRRRSCDLQAARSDWCFALAYLSLPNATRSSDASGAGLPCDAILMLPVIRVVPAIRGQSCDASRRPVSN